MSESTNFPNIYQRVRSVMGRVKGVGKDSENKHGKYRYAGHDAVTEALRGEYVNQGIVRQASVLEQNCTPDGTVLMTVEVSFVNTDNPTDRIVLEIPAIQPAQTTGKSLTAQQVGQAISYAVKNAEFKLFSLIGDPEPDADSDGARAQEDRGESDPNRMEEALVPLVNMFRCAESVAEVTAANDHAKSIWATISGIPGVVETLTAERKAAFAHVRSLEQS